MRTAYSYRYPHIENQILIECYLSLPGDGAKETDALKALWDTGAMCTCVSLAKAQELGLTQVNTTQVMGANNEPFDAPVYIVKLRMGKFELPIIQVIGLPMENTGHEVIIGMDIISRGDLAITNYLGRTTITFREPSLETIDYVAEIELYKKCCKVHALNVRKGITDKCACGSGKEFKNCHGKSLYAKA